MVDGAPTIVKEAAAKEEAEEYKETVRRSWCYGYFKIVNPIINSISLTNNIHINWRSFALSTNTAKKNGVRQDFTKFEPLLPVPDLASNST